MKKFRAVLAASVVISLATGFGGGFLFFKHKNPGDTDAVITQVTNPDGSKSDAVDFALFWQVWNRLHEKYVDQDKLDAQALVYGAISGMVDAAGDPYTVFFPPAEAKKFETEISGSFSGVGMEIGRRNDVITVVAPLKDSPAIRAGIKAGDVILKIDDRATDGMSVDEAVTLIRGRKGTSVTLTIMREGESEPLVISIVRDNIRIPAVEWKLISGHVAYLQLFSFNANATQEFARAAQEIIANGGADRLIIDLRGNPGGLLNEAVDIAGWMLPPGSVVVQERYGNGVTDQLRAQGNARLAKMPTTILMDGGSASAAEILAGALHDDRNIPLVGEKSFGKGSVQQIEDFFNGSALKVTIAKWLTPNGVSISETGIAPTVPVVMDLKEFQAKGWEIGTPGKDPQLDKALETVSNLR